MTPKKEEVLISQQLLPLRRIEDEYEVPPQEVRRAIKAGKLEALKTGHRVLVRRFDLEKWLEVSYG